MNEKILKHPCEMGLTPECFRAYPAWARQALAYKLLHIVLPKQLAQNLPRGLNLPLVPPGVSLPPGVVFPPGTVVPPGVSFPPGWTPGDPAPPGVIIPPPVSPTPPDSGATPPIYTTPWEPGPIKGPGGIIQPPFDIGSLVYDQGSTTAGQSFGYDSTCIKIAGYITDELHVNVRGVYFKIGKYGAPTDNLNIEIWRTIPSWKPDYLVTGGAATPISGASLPAFSIDQAYILALFPNVPHLDMATAYTFVFSRSGDPDPDNYYTIGEGAEIPWEWLKLNSLNAWSLFESGLLECHIYGRQY